MHLELNLGCTHHAPPFHPGATGTTYSGSCHQEGRSSDGQGLVFQRTAPHSSITAQKPQVWVYAVHLTDDRRGSLFALTLSPMSHTCMQLGGCDRHLDCEPDGTRCLGDHQSRALVRAFPGDYTKSREH